MKKDLKMKYGIYTFRQVEINLPHILVLPIFTALARTQTLQMYAHQLMQSGRISPCGISCYVR